MIGYLDPGLSTMVFRAIIAGGITIGFVFRNTFSRLFRSLFGKKKS
jgi:hypothetical protein